MRVDIGIFQKILQNPFGRLLCCFVFSYIISNHISLIAVRFFYTLSIVIAEIFMLFLPFIVSTYLLYSLVSIGHNAFYYLILLLLAIFFSNFCCILTAYGFSHIFFLPNFSVQTNLIPTNSISPLVTVTLSQYINIKYVTIISLIISLILVFLPLSDSIRQEINSKLHRIQKFLTILLTKIFTSILPLYIFGYMLKLFYDGTFLLLVKYYLPIILSNIIVVVTYILFLYLLASKVLNNKTYHTLFNMLPAGLTAFVTMSSIATIPITLIGIEKNLTNSKFAKLIVISTVNIHIIGDNMIITMTALALLTLFGETLPDINTCLVYVFFISVVNLSCIGIPGGCIVIILPILQEYLGMSIESISALTIIYVLQDPLITSINVLGNGAFTILFERLLQKFKI